MLVTLLPIVMVVKMSAFRKCIVSDAGDTVGDCDVGQAIARQERIVPDTGDVGADRNAS